MKTYRDVVESYDGFYKRLDHNWSSSLWAAEAVVKALREVHGFPKGSIYCLPPKANSPKHIIPNSVIEYVEDRNCYAFRLILRPADRHELDRICSLMVCLTPKGAKIKASICDGANYTIDRGKNGTAAAFAAHIVEKVISDLSITDPYGFDGTPTPIGFRVSPTRFTDGSGKPKLVDPTED